MSILIRRINRAKWEQIINEDDNIDVSADAITNCLKTSNNDLSVWKIANITELDNAILALITGSMQTRLSTLHYVMIDEDALLKSGLTINNTDGDTAVVDLKKTHNDISNLTYIKLGIVKNLILDSIKIEKSSFFTKSQLKNLMKNAISEGRLQKSNLNDELIENEKL